MRVLAIDQAVEEKNGQKVVVGKTATLELTPDQAETLALSRQLGTLSLALRSLRRLAIVDSRGRRRRKDDGAVAINTVRYGVSTVRDAALNAHGGNSTMATRTSIRATALAGLIVGPGLFRGNRFVPAT